MSIFSNYYKDRDRDIEIEICIEDRRPIIVENSYYMSVSSIYYKTKGKRTNIVDNHYFFVFSQLLQKYPCNELVRSPVAIPQSVRLRTRGLESNISISTFPNSAPVNQPSLELG